MIEKTKTKLDFINDMLELVIADDTNQLSDDEHKTLVEVSNMIFMLINDE